MTQIITLRARSAHDNGDGTFSIEVTSRPLQTEEEDVLDALFPDLASEVGKLLIKQALFNAVKYRG